MYGRGYNYSEESGRLNSPQDEVIKTVEVLVQHSIFLHGGAVVVQEHTHRFSGTLLSEALAHGLRSLIPRRFSLSGASRTKAEAPEMTARRQTEAQFKEERAKLQLIVDNPQLAEVAYPDSDVRAKILGMVDDLHRQTTSRRKTSDAD